MSEKRGYRSAVATPRRAVAAASSRSARRKSERRRNSSAGTPTGTMGGRADGSLAASLTTSLPGGSPSSTASRCRACLAAFSSVGMRACVLELGRGLQDVELARDPCGKACAGEVDGRLLGDHVRARDLDLVPVAAQLEVAARHLREHRDEHVAPRFLGRLDVRDRGLDLAPHAAEHVDLPARVEAGLKVLTAAAGEKLPPPISAFARSRARLRS
ncbi:MAG: hypothetical protein U1E76_09780 [Planctomycetota bacterium]